MRHSMLQKPSSFPCIVPEYTLSDAHAHIGSDEELAKRIRTKIPSLISTTSPEEFEQVRKSGHSDILIPTFGIHPWNASKHLISDVEEYLKDCRLIGEIGMDSLWCDIPLPTQEKVFRQQLQIAYELKKPAILHTKGCEEQIADIIRDYDNLYLIHWYSSEYYLEKYLSLNCYFTIGPDVFWNPAVRQVVSAVPFDRLLTETDGMEAVRWAYEEAVGKGYETPEPPVSVKDSLLNTLKTIAAILGKSENAVGKQIEDNFSNFIMSGR